MSKIKNKQLSITSDFNINDKKLINVAYPLTNKDGASKIYVDDRIQDILDMKGQPNGFASLDANGKILYEEVPDGALGQVVYQGLWDATNDNPVLPDPTTCKGWYFIVAVAGNPTYLPLDFQVGDWVISDGVYWRKVDNTDAVVTVQGRIGNVVIDKTDVGLSNVDNTSDLDKPVSTATQTAIGNLSGTNGISRSGNNFKLGGTLVESTVVYGNNYVLTLGTNSSKLNEFDAYASDNITLNSGLNISILADNAINFSTNEVYSNLYLNDYVATLKGSESSYLTLLNDVATLHANVDNYIVLSNGFTIASKQGDNTSAINANAGGILYTFASTNAITQLIDKTTFNQLNEYTEDLSASYVDRSIPDVAWVNSRVESVPVVTSLETLLAGTLDGDIIKWGSAYNTWATTQSSVSVESKDTYYFNKDTNGANTPILQKYPTVLLGEQASVQQESHTVYPLGRYVSDKVNRTNIQAGNWSFILYLNNTLQSVYPGINSFKTNIAKRTEVAGLTVTTIGTGNIRTLTVAGGNPFSAEMANSDIALSASIELSNELCFYITEFSSSNTVNVFIPDSNLQNLTDEPLIALNYYIFNTDSTYFVSDNEIHKYEISKSVNTINTNLDDKIVFTFFIYNDTDYTCSTEFTYDGNLYLSSIKYPTSLTHNELAGLDDGETYLHLTSEEKANLGNYVQKTGDVMSGSLEIDAQLLVGGYSSLGANQVFTLSGNASTYYRNLKMSPTPFGAIPFGPAIDYQTAGMITGVGRFFGGVQIAGLTNNYYSNNSAISLTGYHGSNVPTVGVIGINAWKSNPEYNDRIAIADTEKIASFSTGSVEKLSVRGDGRLVYTNDLTFTNDLEVVNKKYVDNSGKGSYLSTAIFVDTTNGEDDNTLYRGQSGKPYATVEYAIANTATYQAVVVTTNNTTTLSGISGSDILKFKIGQPISGSGIQPQTTVISIGASSVVISKSTTASATITAKVWTPIICYVYGNGTITGNWYKEGFYIENYGDWVGDSIILLNAGTTVPEIDYRFINHGNISLTGTSSRLYYYNNTSFANYTAKYFNVGNYESEGTNYQIQDFYYQYGISGEYYSPESNGVFTITGNKFNCKQGKIGYLQGVANVTWDVHSYGLTDGLYIINLASNEYDTVDNGFIKITKPINCPLNVQGLYLQGRFSVQANIAGNVILQGYGESIGDLDGYTHSILGGNILVRYLKARVSVDIYGKVDIENLTNNTYNSTNVNCYGRVDFKDIVSGYIMQINVKSSGVAYYPKNAYGTSVVVESGGKLFIDKDWVGSTYNNSFYISGYCKLSSKLDLSSSAYTEFKVNNGGEFIISPDGYLKYGNLSTYRFQLLSGSKTRIKGTLELTSGSYIQKDGGLLELDGAKILVSNNQNIIKCTADTSDSKDIQLFKAITNCDNITYSLLNAFDVNSFIPNDIVGGDLYENTLFT